MDTLKFTKIRDVKSPCRAHSTDAGIDFFVPTSFNNGETYYIKPGESIMISGGLKLKVPSGHALVFFNKSGIAAKKNLVLGACVVDESYQGELMYNLHNIGTSIQVIVPGEKITQGVLLRMDYLAVEEVPSVEDLYGGVSSARGEGGFGSTGDK